MSHEWLQLVVYTCLFTYVMTMLVVAGSALRSHFTLLKWDAVSSPVYVPLVFIAVAVVAVLAGWLIFPTMWWSGRRRRRAR